jgi:hypothetical protein
MELDSIVESLVGKREEKEKKEQIFFVLKREMQGDLFIPKSWTYLTTWVEEI